MLAGVCVYRSFFLGRVDRILESRSGSAPSTSFKVFSVEKGEYVMTEKVDKTEQEWKELLTPEQFHIMREKGTERAFTGKYADHHDHGVYRCAGCDLDLFHSKTKFESGTGWPSFTSPVALENIQSLSDNSLFMTRTEVLCSPMRGASGSCLFRRTCADRAALLYQFGRASVFCNCR